MKQNRNKNKQLLHDLSEHVSEMTNDHLVLRDYNQIMTNDRQVLIDDHQVFINNRQVLIDDRKVLTNDRQVLRDDRVICHFPVVMSHSPAVVDDSRMGFCHFWSARIKTRWEREEQMSTCLKILQS